MLVNKFNMVSGGETASTVDSFDENTVTRLNLSRLHSGQEPAESIIKVVPFESGYAQIFET